MAALWRSWRVSYTIVAHFAHISIILYLYFLADEILADWSQNRQSAKINSPPKCIPRQNFRPTVWCVHFISPTSSLSLFPSPWYNAWATTAAVCTKQVVPSVTFLLTTPNYHLHACAHVYLRVPTCGYSVVLATYMVSHVCWFACVCQKRPLSIPHLTVTVHGRPCCQCLHVL